MSRLDLYQPVMMPLIRSSNFPKGFLYPKVFSAPLLNTHICIQKRRFNYDENSGGPHEHPHPPRQYLQPKDEHLHLYTPPTNSFLVQHM